MDPSSNGGLSWLGGRGAMSPSGLVQLLPIVPGTGGANDGLKEFRDNSGGVIRVNAMALGISRPAPLNGRSTPRASNTLLGRTSLPGTPTQPSREPHPPTPISLTSSQSHGTPNSGAMTPRCELPSTPLVLPSQSLGNRVGTPYSPTSSIDSNRKKSTRSRSKRSPSIDNLSGTLCSSENSAPEYNNGTAENSQNNLNTKNNNLNLQFQPQNHQQQQILQTLQQHSRYMAPSPSRHNNLVLLQQQQQHLQNVFNTSSSSSNSNSFNSNNLYLHYSTIDSNSNNYTNKPMPNSSTSVQHPRVLTASPAATSHSAAPPSNSKVSEFFNENGLNQRNAYNGNVSSLFHHSSNHYPSGPNAELQTQASIHHTSSSASSSSARLGRINGTNGISLPATRSTSRDAQSLSRGSSQGHLFHNNNSNNNNNNSNYKNSNNNNGNQNNKGGSSISLQQLPSKEGIGTNIITQRLKLSNNNTSSSSIVANMINSNNNSNNNSTSCPTKGSSHHHQLQPGVETIYETVLQDGKQLLQNATTTTSSSTTTTTTNNSVPPIVASRKSSGTSMNNDNNSFNILTTTATPPTTINSIRHGSWSPVCAARTSQSTSNSIDYNGNNNNLIENNCNNTSSIISRLSSDTNNAIVNQHTQSYVSSIKNINTSLNANSSFQSESFTSVNLIHNSHFPNNNTSNSMNNNVQTGGVSSSVLTPSSHSGSSVNYNNVDNSDFHSQLSPVMVYHLSNSNNSNNNNINFNSHTNTPTSSEMVAAPTIASGNIGSLFGFSSVSTPTSSKGTPLTIPFSSFAHAPASCNNQFNNNNQMSSSNNNGYNHMQDKNEIPHVLSSTSSSKASPISILPAIAPSTAQNIHHSSISSATSFHFNPSAPPSNSYKPPTPRSSSLKQNQNQQPYQHHQHHSVRSFGSSTSSSNILHNAAHYNNSAFPFSYNGNQISDCHSPIIVNDNGVPDSHQSNFYDDAHPTNMNLPNYDREDLNDNNNISSPSPVHSNSKDYNTNRFNLLITGSYDSVNIQKDIGKRNSNDVNKSQSPMPSNFNLSASLATAWCMTVEGGQVDNEAFCFTDYNNEDLYEGEFPPVARQMQNLDINEENQGLENYQSTNHHHHSSNINYTSEQNKLSGENHFESNLSTENNHNTSTDLEYNQYHNDGSNVSNELYEDKANPLISNASHSFHNCYQSQPGQFISRHQSHPLNTHQQQDQYNYEANITQHHSRAPSASSPQNPSTNSGVINSIGNQPNNFQTQRPGAMPQHGNLVTGSAIVTPHMNNNNNASMAVSSSHSNNNHIHQLHHNAIQNISIQQSSNNYNTNNHFLNFHPPHSLGGDGRQSLIGTQRSSSMPDDIDRRSEVGEDDGGGDGEFNALNHSSTPGRSNNTTGNNLIAVTTTNNANSASYPQSNIIMSNYNQNNLNQSSMMTSTPLPHHPPQNHIPQQQSQTAKTTQQHAHQSASISSPIPTSLSLNNASFTPSSSVNHQNHQQYQNSTSLNPVGYIAASCFSVDASSSSSANKHPLARHPTPTNMSSAVPPNRSAWTANRPPALSSPRSPSSHSHHAATFQNNGATSSALSNAINNSNAPPVSASTGRSCSMTVREGNFTQNNNTTAAATATISAINAFSGCRTNTPPQNRSHQVQQQQQQTYSAYGNNNINLLQQQQQHQSGGGTPSGSGSQLGGGHPQPLPQQQQQQQTSERSRSVGASSTTTSVGNNTSTGRQRRCWATPSTTQATPHQSQSLLFAMQQQQQTSNSGTPTAVTSTVLLNNNGNNNHVASPVSAAIAMKPFLSSTANGAANPAACVLSSATSTTASRSYLRRPPSPLADNSNSFSATTSIGCFGSSTPHAGVVHSNTPMRNSPAIGNRVSGGFNTPQNRPSLASNINVLNSNNNNNNNNSNAFSSVTSNILGVPCIFGGSHSLYMTSGVQSTQSRPSGIPSPQQHPSTPSSANILPAQQQLHSSINNSNNLSLCNNNNNNNNGYHSTNRMCSSESGGGIVNSFHSAFNNNNSSNSISRNNNNNTNNLNPNSNSNFGNSSPHLASKTSSIPLLHQILYQNTTAEEEEIPCRPATVDIIRHSDQFSWRRGSLIGQGSLGHVFLGLDLRTGEQFAVKEVLIGQVLRGSVSDQIRDTAREIVQYGFAEEDSKPVGNTIRRCDSPHIGAGRASTPIAGGGHCNNSSGADINSWKFGESSGGGLPSLRALITAMRSSNNNGNNNNNNNNNHISDNANADLNNSAFYATHSDDINENNNSNNLPLFDNNNNVQASPGSSNLSGCTALEQLLNEISLYETVKHPNIVSYKGFDILGSERLFVYLELMQGGSIARMVQEFGPLPEALVKRYAAQVLLGLDRLHASGIVHRDIKGANILVSHDASVVKLSDFGCSKRLLSQPNSSSHITNTNGDNNNISFCSADGNENNDSFSSTLNPSSLDNSNKNNKNSIPSCSMIDNTPSLAHGYHSSLTYTLKGSVLWMPPEVIASSGHGRKADIWAIGCLIIEMVTGRPPWSEMNFDNLFQAMLFIMSSSEGPSCPKFLSESGRDFLRLCFKRNPTERPPVRHLLAHPFVKDEILELLNGALHKEYAASIGSSDKLIDLISSLTAATEFKDSNAGGISVTQLNELIN